MTRYEFNCPSCGSCVAEKVTPRVEMEETMTEFTEGLSIDYTFERMVFDLDCAPRFQCHSCGYQLDDIHDDFAFKDWLRKHGRKIND